MITFLNILTEIKDQILSGITVFDHGYAYARLDSDKGLTATVGNDAKYIGINDTEGDYFYIRVPDKISASTAKSKTDCSVAVSQKYPCSLVAVVSDADEFQLTDAIANILMKTKVADVKAIWIDAIAVVAEEFKGLDKEGIEAVKARIGNRTIVRIDFDLTRIFETNNCEYSICKTC